MIDKTKREELRRRLINRPKNQPTTVLVSVKELQDLLNDSEQLYQAQVEMEKAISAWEATNRHISPAHISRNASEAKSLVSSSAFFNRPNQSGSAGLLRPPMKKANR